MRPTRLAIAALLALAGLAAPRSAPAQIILYAKGTIPANASDLSGLEGEFEGRDGKPVPANRFASFGSGLAYSGQGTRFYALDDRGPADGKAAFPCRFHELELVWPASREADAAPGPAEIEWKLSRTVILKDENGLPRIGKIDAIDATDALSTRLDPEAIRILPGGRSLLISDEYGPSIEQYDLISGERQRRFEIPTAFAQPKPDTDPDSDKPSGATTGRDRNRGFEGLAISPDGGILTAIIQSPLLQDHARENVASGKRIGVNCRMLQIAMTPNAEAPTSTREFIYPLEDPRDVVSELLAIDQTRFLVLERDGKGGEEAIVKRLYMIDTLTATDVSARASLPKGELPDDLAPVRKVLWLDMLDPALGILGPGLPEKWEALTFGPDLADGRRTIVVASDNDFRDDQPTYIWVFAFRPEDLRWPETKREAEVIPITPPTQ